MLRDNYHITSELRYVLYLYILYIHHRFIYDVIFTLVIFIAIILRIYLTWFFCVLNQMYIVLYRINLQHVQMNIFSLIDLM